MKKSTRPLLTLALLLAGSTSPLMAGNTSWSPVVGMKYYAEHSALNDVPFSSGDLGYIAGLEFEDSSGYLQILATYAPDLDGTKWLNAGREEVADYTITPEVNLVAEDKGWRAGFGILSSYVVTDLNEDWTDIYYQFLLGYTLGDQGWKLSFMADYPFEGIGELDAFDFNEINFSAQLRISL